MLRNFERFDPIFPTTPHTQIIKMPSDAKMRKRKMRQAESMDWLAEK
jgi:hypothetical protein